jgi:hypothetical protein
MSDIYGTGWGSSHDWHYEYSNDTKHSFYTCRACKAFFVHSYDRIPNIFDALKLDGEQGLNRFPDQCPGKQPCEHEWTKPLAGRAEWCAKCGAAKP